jgi:DNA-binding MarR family transcriptional regulator
MTASLANVLEVCLALRARRLARKISRRFDTALAPLDLDSSQFNILSVIGALSPVTLRDVASTLDLDASTLSRMIKNLESKGLLGVEGGRGRSGLWVWLSQRGEDVMMEGLQAWKGVQSHLASHVGDAQLGQALGLFDRLERAAQGK